MHARQIRRFGAFALDPVLGVLHRDGSVVPLAPQPTRLLELLVDRAGGLVTHEEIRAHLWPDRVVDFERGIHFCVGQVRAALGETAADAAFVVTVPARGYRFGAAVTLDAMTRGRRLPRRPALAALIAVVAVTLSAWLAQPVGPVHRIEVTPVIGDGPLASQLDRALRTELARKPGLEVVSTGGDWIVSSTLTFDASSDPQLLRLEGSVAASSGRGGIEFGLETTPRDVDLLAEDMAHEIARSLDARRGRTGNVEMEVARKD